MTLTGPQIYPGASTSYWYEDNYGGTLMESNVIPWHTTEGRSLPGYEGGATAPNFTAVPDFKNRRIVWYQHFRFDVSSRALRNQAGGVQTNTLNASQVELVGTCDRRHATTWTLGGVTYKAGVDYLYSGNLPDWVIRDLAAFALWANKYHGVPLSSGLTFKPYPDSYGESNGVRMSGARWMDFKGHCGHQHVPENDHGDPGSFPMAKILEVAKGGTITGGTDVALTDADAKKVWSWDGIKAPLNDPDNPTWAPSSYLRNIYLGVQDARREISALATPLTQLTAKTDAQAVAIAELAKAVATLSTEIDADDLVAKINTAVEGVGQKVAQQIESIEVNLDVA